MVVLVKSSQESSNLEARAGMTRRELPRLINIFNKKVRALDVKFCRLNSSLPRLLRTRQCFVAETGSFCVPFPAANPYGITRMTSAKLAQVLRIE